MTQQSLQQQHSDTILRAVERQRNESLTREAHKDALVALLQSQNAGLKEKLTAADARIQELESKIQALETAAMRKKPRAA